MEKKYIIPASTLLAGILIWVVFIVVYYKDEITSVSEITIGIITGGLLILSAYACKRAEGPKAGNIFRASLLFVIAILSYWLIGITSAVLLLVSSVAVLFLVLKKSEKLSEAVKI